MVELHNRITVLSMDDHQEIARCFDAFLELRPHLTRTAFVDRVRAQAAQGYAIAYIEADARVVAAAGFRIAHFLAWGKVLYIDDLTTCASHRGRGFGGALLDWLVAHAKTLACDAVHLDSGYARHDAHRLYLNNGFTLSSHHLAKTLT